MFWPLLILQLAATGGIAHIALKTKRVSWVLLSVGMLAIAGHRWLDHIATHSAHVSAIEILIPVSLLAGAVAVHREHNREVSDLHRLAESVPNLVWVTDPSGEITYTNHRLLAYTGGCPKDFRHLQGISFVHPEDQDQVGRNWLDSLRTGVPLELELRLRDHHGVYRWFLVRSVPVNGDHGIAHWYGTATDVHEMHTLLDQLRPMS